MITGPRRTGEQNARPALDVDCSTFDVQCTTAKTAVSSRIDAQVFTTEPRSRLAPALRLRLSFATSTAGGRCVSLSPPEESVSVPVPNGHQDNTGRIDAITGH